jgi:hypothetical protein
LNVKTIFEQAYNYKRDNDSHMMKNTEWGAVAYLSLSKYGINGEVNINNFLHPYKTGYSATSNTNQSVYPGDAGLKDDKTLPYNTETGYKASTTGNISGVYDMSGGSEEYMASFKDGELSESGFESDPVLTYGTKYFDKYNSNSSYNSYNYRILGDATGETGPFYYYQDEDGNHSLHNNWYKDNASFITSYSWFVRGQGVVAGVKAGQLAFSKWRGNADSSFGFRIVLAK